MKQTDDPWQAVRNVIAHAIEGVVALVGAIALMIIVGMVIDARSKHAEDHDSCLKRAIERAAEGSDVQPCY